MNPLYQIMIASSLWQKRTCPSCKKEQVVAPGGARKTVQCKFCGKPIPPPPDTRR